MGCGKSSVGRRLSQLLCCRFMDLDSAIEERQGRSVQEIFATEGEAAFRAMELETLETLTGASLCVHSDDDMPLPDLEGNGIDPMYSRGPLPQSGSLPLAGGGRMPLSYYRVNTSDSRDVKSDVLVLGLFSVAPVVPVSTQPQPVSSWALSRKATAIAKYFFISFPPFCVVRQ